jgi:hypothetical protein
MDRPTRQQPADRSAGCCPYRDVKSLRRRLAPQPSRNGDLLAILPSGPFGLTFSEARTHRRRKLVERPPPTLRASLRLVLTGQIADFMVRRRTRSERATNGRSGVPMQSCATCGKTDSIRLYYVQVGSGVARRWWCPECWFSALRLGANAELAPVWAERAALNLLPMKPLRPS